MCVRVRACVCVRVCVCTLFTGSWCFCAFASLQAGILEDQLLRAHGLGRTRMENPNRYLLRTGLHKLYYHFKPKRFYWKLVIIGRKFMVAMSGVLFRRVSTFQLGVVLLVLIVSCA